MVEVMNKNWIKVATLSELTAGIPKVLDVKGLPVAIFKIEGTDSDGIYAVQDVCTHDDGPVAEGSLEGTTIECPRHGARFDIRTGAVLSMPAVVPIQTFPVRVRGSEIEIEVPE